MTVITFVGAKGGVGTTTIAACAAIGLARHGTVELVGRGDATVVLGLPSGDQNVQPGFTVTDAWHLPHPWNEYTIVDAGTSWPEHTSHLTFLVVRNDHMSLRRAMAMPRADRVILVEETERALGADDVADVLGITPVVFALTASIARAVDAGLLACRAPSIGHELAELVTTASHSVAA